MIEGDGILICGAGRSIDIRLHEVDNLKIENAALKEKIAKLLAVQRAAEELARNAKELAHSLTGEQEAEDEIEKAFGKITTHFILQTKGALTEYFAALAAYKGE